MRRYVIASALFLAANLMPARAENASGALTQADLEKLVERIALFPDPLIAQILPASTYPLEIAEAAKFCRAKEGMAKSNPADFQKEIDQQNWEPSVKAVALCPDVLRLLNDDLDWTGKLGEAFLAQPVQLMKAIQILRAKAQASGALQDTDQQTFLIDDDGFQIIPSDPDIICVPVYDPQKVYVQTLPAEVVEDDDTAVAAGGGMIRFGAGVALGQWLANDCRWGAHPGVYTHGYPHYGYAHRAHVAHYSSYNVTRYERVKKKTAHIDRAKLDQKYGQFNGAPVTRPRNPIAKPTPYTDNQGRWQHSPEHRRGQTYQNSKAASQALFSAENSRARLQDASRNGWGEKPPAAPASPRTRQEDRPELSDEDVFDDPDWGDEVREESVRGNESLGYSDHYHYSADHRRIQKRPAQLPAGGTSRPSGGGRGGAGGRR